MKRIPWLVRLGLSLAASVAAAFVSAIIIGVADIWTTGHGYASILGDAPIWEPGGLHSRIGGLAMVIAAVATGVLTWRRLGRVA
jgi:hypothetical protein